MLAGCCDSWVPVITALCVLRLLMEERPPVRRSVANILNIRLLTPRTTDTTITTIIIIIIIIITYCNWVVTRWLWLFYM